MGRPRSSPQSHASRVVVEAHVREDGDAVRVVLHVKPRSARDELSADDRGRLVLKTTAPPVDGAANDAVITALAALLGVPRSRITIVRGETARDKELRVDGVSRADAVARLAPAP